MRFPSLRRHSRFARDLDAYVDGELAHARVRELEEHLARCTSCDLAQQTAVRVLRLRTFKGVRQYLAKMTRQVCPNVTLLDTKK